MRRLSSIVASIAVVATFAACAPNQAPASAPGVGGPASARVEVQNNNWSDMTIWAYRDGLRVRLGTVTSMATQVFNLPRTIASAAGSIRLVASPLASNTQHTTPAVTIWPGQTIEFRIENQIGISTVSVWD
jgi:hypothetical protein